jgi:catechol 2,3-dioxygenase-like lactoylglutathione lyase family enzyme
MRSDAASERAPAIGVSHVHCGVKDLNAAIQWFSEVWRTTPTFANERMAVLLFGEFSLILDRSAIDTQATIGFHSGDCDDDYRVALEHGASSIQAPFDTAWGARAAYLKGPGGLVLELEQLRQAE